MASSTARWQARIGELAMDPATLPACDYAAMADALLQNLKFDQSHPG